MQHWTYLVKTRCLLGIYFLCSVTVPWWDSLALVLSPGNGAPSYCQLPISIPETLHCPWPVLKWIYHINKYIHIYIYTYYINE